MKKGLITLMLLGLLCGCSASADTETNDVVNDVSENIENDFKELGEETEDAAIEDGKEAKEDTTIEGDFNDLT